jgi:hypothetical protein
MIHQVEDQARLNKILPRRIKVRISLVSITGLILGSLYYLSAGVILSGDAADITKLILSEH